MTQVIQSSYLLISSSFSSYFIFNIMAFCNLALMYDFLLLSSLPVFSADIYRISIQMLYEESSILKWLVKILELDEDVLTPAFES